MNYTWTKDLCDRFLDTDGHSELRPQTLLDTLVTTTSTDTCTVTTLVLSIIFCICGVVTNLINILAFTCNSEVQDDKTSFLMTIVVSDLLFLLSNLPYFILQTGYIHLDQSQYAQLGIYIGIRYALSFILICASSWMLVALVTKKILSTQIEGDDTSIKPLRESDQAADGKEQTKFLLKSSSVCIVALPVVATFIHGVKLFEYQIAGDSPDAPWLMKKRLTGLEYELYTVTVNVAVTMLAPYMFLLCSTVYYLVKVVTVMMRRKGEREPILDIWLLCLLGILHLVCYGGSLYQQMTVLFTKVVPVDNSCSDNINTTLIILNASVKILLFKLFTYHFKRYQLPLKDVSYFLTKQNKGDVVRGLNYSFSNPSYDKERD
ncbi:uncharacterized protein LOC110466401 [Mizuhopecten yessoensis]|uniref:uncharacterized protein LOC110466401 n=1 Tax=Mizuhopecten yessoensis TaxID=6573 RepID=UPI000B457B28|nr:uncharacterized protein LOC110466401 [Mizuhopecten yessoensis]